MNEEEYKYILESWKGRLMPLGRDYFNSENILMGLESKKFLTEVGLPILGFEYRIKFLPNTTIFTKELNNERYYIVGDLYIYDPSVSLVGIKDDTENVYNISKFINEKDPRKISFLNSNITKFIFFLTKICMFYKEIQSLQKHQIDKNEFDKRLDNLIKSLSNEDKTAMENSEYWRGIINYIDIDFADFLDTTPIEHNYSNKNEPFDIEDLPF